MLQAAILTLQGPDAPDVGAGDEDMAPLSQADRRNQVQLLTCTFHPSRLQGPHSADTELLLTVIIIESGTPTK